tara:strand:+ start:6177 stop:6392 length:216 start_codon:yes stop_codon:yes gene_type:complete
MKKLLKKWMVFVEHFGNFQMGLLMTIIYFSLVPFYFIKLYFDDPLRLKKPKNTNWQERKEENFVDNFEEQG